jgi:hypothetical protein
MSERKYWARVLGKRVNPLAIVGPCEDRDECVKQACKIALTHKSAISISHGYGEFGPSFDIRWLDSGYKGEKFREFLNQST